MHLAADAIEREARLLLRLEPIIQVGLRVGAGDEDPREPREDDAEDRHRRHELDQRVAALVAPGLPKEPDESGSMRTQAHAPLSSAPP